MFYCCGRRDDFWFDLQFVKLCHSEGGHAWCVCLCMFNLSTNSILPGWDESVLTGGPATEKNNKREKNEGLEILYISIDIYTHRHTLCAAINWPQDKKLYTPCGSLDNDVINPLNMVENKLIRAAAGAVCGGAVIINRLLYKTWFKFRMWSHVKNCFSRRTNRRLKRSGCVEKKQNKTVCPLKDFSSGGHL